MNESVISLAISVMLGGAFAAGIVHWNALRARRREASRFDHLRTVARKVVRARRQMSVERDIPALFATACRALFESGLASVAMIVNTGYGVTTIVQISGRKTALCAADFDWPDPGSEEPSDDPCIRCLRSGEPELCSDLQAAVQPSDSRSRPWTAAAVEAGFRSQIALPIEQNGRLFTVLNLFADTPGAFDGSVSAILAAFVGDLAHAIERVEQESLLRELAVEAKDRADQIGSLLDAIPNSMLLLSVPEGRIIYVNNFFCERAAMPREQVVGKSMRELPFGLLEDDRKKALARLSSEGRVVGMELMQRMRDGEIGPVLVNIEYVQYLGRTCVIVSASDLRELREAQQAEQAKLTAEAANHAKSEFLTRLGHELRNPLNAVIGFTQLLRDEALPRLSPSDLVRVDNVIRAGWHLLALTNDILDLSRIELGRLAVTTAALPLADELAFALAMSGQLAAGNAVRLHRVHGPEGLMVVADQVRFRQVMLNLLSNAIKYNRRGGEVWVRVDADDDEVLIDVVDNGLGMTREQMQKLFEPFNRLGRERESVEGLGVGLAVSRELLRLMNGRLEVDSSPTTGTRFRVILPRGSSIDALPSLAPSSSPTAFSSLVSGLVLYIEDSPISALLVEQLLARFSGVRLVHVDTGAAGLQLIASLSPDLVLLDMQLPDMDGFDVLHKLSRSGLPANTRVVALSGSAMPEEVEQALRIGASDFWTKPLIADRFLSGVTSMLATAGTQADN